MYQLTTLLVWSSFAHLVADWLLQNEWMVRNKTNLRHPAAWVHGAIHVFVLCFVLPWMLALLIGFSHVLIDTRKPLQWWKRIVGKTAADPTSRLPQTLIVEIWVDQVMHIVVLAVVICIAY